MLKVNHLYKSYRSGSNVYEVLKDVNFEVRKGEFVAVMGLPEAERPHCSTAFHASFPTIKGRYCWMEPIFQDCRKAR